MENAQQFIPLTPEFVSSLVERISNRVIEKLNDPVRGQSRMQPETLSCSEFADRIGRKRKFVQRLIARQKVYVLPGKPYRIPASELHRFLAPRDSHTPAVSSRR